MSHDIRTPLTSIVGNTAAILENEDSFSPEQKRRLLEDVNEDAQWLIRMVENLLSITRMSGGQAKIEKDCEAAEEIVGVSVSKFTKRFPAILVSIEVPDEVRMVPMDATLIRQVIMNLLENAVANAVRTALSAVFNTVRRIASKFFGIIAHTASDVFGKINKIHLSYVKKHRKPLQKSHEIVYNKESLEDNSGGSETGHVIKAQVRRGINT